MLGVLEAYVSPVSVPVSVELTPLSVCGVPEVLLPPPHSSIALWRQCDDVTCCVIVTCFVSPGASALD